jgi:hypothetical protein
MKRIIYAALFAMFCTLAITSCTEEEVTPNTENGGGLEIDPIKKG